MTSTGNSLGMAAFALRQVFGDDWPWVAAVIVLGLSVGLARVMRVASIHRIGGGNTLPGAPGRLRYSTDGRSGRVHFESPRASFALYWEFGGGDTLAIIDVPPAREWQKKTGLPVAERASVLDFIARQVVRDQTTKGSNRYSVGYSAITIYA